jgi:hypothetical protein
MRLDICGQFIVRVLMPNGGCSKGRPVALIEDTDKWTLTDLLIPNDLCEADLETYVADKFAAFAPPGRAIRRLDATPKARLERAKP